MRWLLTFVYSTMAKCWKWRQRYTRAARRRTKNRERRKISICYWDIIIYRQFVDGNWNGKRAGECGAGDRDGCYQLLCWLFGLWNGSFIPFTTRIVIYLRRVHRRAMTAVHLFCHLLGRSSTLRIIQLVINLQSLSIFNFEASIFE